MTSPPQLQHMKLALRGQVCNECAAPVHSLPQPPTVVAQCEDACPLFVNLPRLARVVEAGEPPCGYEIFAKSLEPFPGNAPGPDVAHALTVLEAAASASETESADVGGCKRLTRIATELACLPQPAEPSEGHA
jgi:hypothetical protein